jgi:hypothetical protein
LRSLQEIQPDFEDEAKAYAGLWSQGKKRIRIRIRIRIRPFLNICGGNCVSLYFRESG